MANLKSQAAIICVIGLPMIVVAAIFGPTAFDLAMHSSMPVTRFFVGSEENYRREVDPAGRILPNCG